MNLYIFNNYTDSKFEIILSPFSLLIYYESTGLNQRKQYKDLCNKVQGYSSFGYLAPYP